ncbi:hypothetical protein BDAP_000593 [Binucleata daphniae]
MQELIASNPLLRQKTFIMDNAKIHHATQFKPWVQANNISIRYLPAYSPQLNPIEEFFSCLKSRYTNRNQNVNNFLGIKTLLSDILDYNNNEVTGFCKNLELMLNWQKMVNHYL